MANTLDFVVITGMSGAGKTVAVQSFEDMGYYCVDNMPPSLIPKFWELIKESGKINKVALVIDLRSQEFFDELLGMIKEMNSTIHVTARILFLDASDEVLVSRYKETRRSHPLAMSGRIVDGIKKERTLLTDIKTRAQFVIDTSNLSPRQLRKKINEFFQVGDIETFHVEVLSFGFKYGLPIDADIVMDVRFLPNPYYIKELKPLTGQDEAVYNYVMQQPETEAFYHKFIDLLEYIMPGYRREGKNIVTIAIGCTGGQHRSVALAERVGKKLMVDYPVNINHRDKDKRKETVNRS